MKVKAKPKVVNKVTKPPSNFVFTKKADYIPDYWIPHRELTEEEIAAKQAAKAKKKLENRQKVDNEREKERLDRLAKKEEELNYRPSKEDLEEYTAPPGKYKYTPDYDSLVAANPRLQPYLPPKEERLQGIHDTGITEAEERNFYLGNYIPPEILMTMREASLQKLQANIRYLTQNGDMLIRKLLELAVGVTTENKNGAVYKHRPDIKAIRMLIEYGFGLPQVVKTDEDKESEGQKTQVNIFLPDNFRQKEGPQLQLDSEENIINAGFIEEDE